MNSNRERIRNLKILGRIDRYMETNSRTLVRLQKKQEVLRNKKEEIVQQLYPGWRELYDWVQEKKDTPPHQYRYNEDDGVC